MITIPHFDQPVFPVFYIAGAIAFTVAFFLRARKLKTGTGESLFFFSITVFCAILFSKVLSADFLSQVPDFLSTGNLNFSYTKSVGGGIAGALIALLLCSRILKRNNLQELLFPGWLIGLAAIKIGCLLQGCCYGLVCDHAFGVTYAQDSPAYIDALLTGKLAAHAVHTAPVFPVQLLDSLLALSTIFITLRITKNKPFHSKAFTSLLLFLAFRFITDYLRGERADVWITGYQCMILALVIVVFLLARFLRTATPSTGHNTYVPRLATILTCAAFVCWQTNWFTRAEAFTLLIIGAPAALLAVADWKSKSFVSQHRFKYLIGSWLLIACMSQVSVDSSQTTPDSKYDMIGDSAQAALQPPNSSTIQVGGMGGKWTDICGGSHTYTAFAAQYKYTHVSGPDQNVSYGMGAWIGKNDDSYPAGFVLNPANYPNDSWNDLFLIHNSYGVNPFFEYNARIVGFRLGMQMGQLYSQGAAFEAPLVIGQRRVAVIPSGNIRLGGRYFFFAGFNDHFPAPSDAPLLKVAFGWRPKKFPQSCFQVGVSDSGIYIAPEFGLGHVTFGAFIAAMPGYFNGSLTVGYRLDHE